jgi:hypothetical protein
LKKKKKKVKFLKRSEENVHVVITGMFI